MIFVVWAFIRFVIGGPEDNWICDDGQWVKHGNPSAPMPSEKCPATSANKPASELSAPIDRAIERITKKPFGIKISPQNSPVQPERFSGYHTGIDFEAFPDEAETDVPISAICNGPLAVKKYASDYGGMAVQKCKLENQDITIVYGHLKLSSITAIINQQLLSGDKIGILGKGFSTETDGERKHLHLGTHKGATINTSGYIYNQTELNNWIDIAKYLSE